MSAFSLRKNNVGRAVVRFLIGAVIIAAIVIALNELVLKKKDNTLPDLSPQPSSVLIADQGHTDEPTVDSEPADGPADVQTGENAVESGDETDDPGTEPDGSEDGTGEIDETGDPGVFGEVTEGLDIVDKIAAVKTGRNDVPVEPVTIISVTIEKGCQKSCCH